MKQAGDNKRNKYKNLHPSELSVLSVC